MIQPVSTNGHIEAPTGIILVMCHACGYTPDGVIAPRQCPKCFGYSTFKTVPMPASILKVAENFPEGCDPRMNYKGFYMRSKVEIIKGPRRKVAASKFKIIMPALPSSRTFAMAED